MAEVVAIAVCSCDGIAQTQHRVIIIGHAQTVNYDCNIFGAGIGVDRG